MPTIDRRVFCAAAAALPAAAFLPSLSKPFRQPHLDEAALQVLARTPGFAMVGSIRGKKVHELRGLREAGKPQAFDEQTLFPVASLTKSVFSYAVRKLVRAGRFDLTRPLGSYMDLGLPGEQARTITARHALTHSTGLPNWIFDPKEELKQDFAPGADWSYSGEGYFLLQRVLETAVLKQPISKFLGETFQQLGMNDSRLVLRKQDESRCARGHGRRGRPDDEDAFFWDRRSYEGFAKLGLDPETSTADEKIAALKKVGKPALHVGITPNVAGSMWTTAGDFERFLSALAADVQAHTDDYLPRIEVNRMIHWADGIGVDVTGGPAWFQWGDSPGYKNLLWVEQGGKTHLAIFSNGERGASLYAWLLRRALDGDRAALYWI